MTGPDPGPGPAYGTPPPTAPHPPPSPPGELLTEPSATGTGPVAAHGPRMPAGPHGPHGPRPDPGTSWTTAPPRRGGVSVLRLLGVLAAGLMLAGGVWSVLIMFFTETATQTATVTAPVTRFVTDTGVGDLTVHAGKAGQAVTVRSTLHWAFQRPTLTTNTDNGILTIFSRCPWFWTGSHCSVDLDVTVPPGTALDLRSTTGSVVATAVSAAVSARTSTGDVDVVSTGSAPVTARTNTGDVEVTAEGTDTNVAATSNTGDVTVTLSGIPSSVQARTNTGNVSVAVPPGTGYHVDIGTDTGSQSVSVPRNDLSTRTISAHSNTGDVTVRSAG